MGSVPRSPEDAVALESLTARLKVILPETYHDCMEDIRPNPMGSAGLKYDEQGRVAWNQIWNSFCDLAMAGGPPHKGKLLQPNPEQPNENSGEIVRGIQMATGLEAEPSDKPGWLRVNTKDNTMAGWLARAITMENVAVQLKGDSLSLPTSPHYTTAKEVKSVIVTVAKTHHYWSSHMSAEQQAAIAQTFAAADQLHPLLQPDYSSPLASPIKAPKSLHPADSEYPGWQGFECPNLWAAVWMMRALAVSNVLARRESNVLFLPTNPQSDPAGTIASQALHQVHHLAGVHGIL